MVDLKTQFESAAQEAQRLPKKPDNDTLLRLYALKPQSAMLPGNAPASPIQWVVPNLMPGKKSRA